MAAITITSNFNEVVGSLEKSIAKITDKNYLLRPVAIEVIPILTERIHGKGVASDGSQIGSYSNSYLAYRKKRNRGADPKVIVSLTRQLENDWSVLETPNGYGIGFTNAFNTQKLQWVEEGKGKNIGSLTSQEIDYAFDRITELVTNAFNQ